MRDEQLTPAQKEAIVRIQEQLERKIQEALDGVKLFEPVTPMSGGVVVQWVEDPERPGVYSPTEPVTLSSGQSASVSFTVVYDSDTGEEIIMPWAEMRVGPKPPWATE